MALETQEDNDFGRTLSDALMTIPDDTYELTSMEYLTKSQINQFLKIFRNGVESITLPPWLNLKNLLFISAEINTNSNAWSHVYRPIIEDSNGDTVEGESNGNLSYEAINNFGLLLC